MKKTTHGVKIRVDIKTDMNLWNNSFLVLNSFLFFRIITIRREGRVVCILCEIMTFVPLVF